MKEIENTHVLGHPTITKADDMTPPTQEYNPKTKKFESKITIITFEISQS